MNPLYILYPLSSLLTICLAIGVGIYLTSHFGLNWRLYWIGALTFVGSQVLHIPFNSYILQPLIRNGGLLIFSDGLGQIVMASFWLGLSAGIFEETARYLVFSRWIKDDRTWSHSLLFGAGHGGIEAIIIGFLILMTYFQLVNLQGQDLKTLLPNTSPEQLALIEQQVAQYWSIPLPMSLMGFVERVFTIPLHIANAVLVLQVFRRNQLRWLWLAVGWHTAINMAALILADQLKGYTWGVYATEGALGLLALVSLAIIIRLRSPDPITNYEAPLVPALKSVIPQPIEETEEDLDRSKYN